MLITPFEGDAPLSIILSKIQVVSLAMERCGFGSVNKYDAKRPLIIDPALTFATYLDTGSDYVYGVATDASGDTYVTGLTFSSTFPTTSGALQTTSSNQAMVYVTKLNPEGTAQIYSTLLGGSSYNQPFGIAVDGNGNAVVTGYTWSTDFPVKNPVATVSHNVGDSYGFIASLTSDGNALNYSSILGGGYTVSNAVAIDIAGNAYITGITDSPLFPVTAGALQTV
jgi:hypothetical protein